MSIIEYSVKNPLIVNLLMVAILILGIMSLIEMPRELIPKVSFHWLFVIVPYPGVGAEDVERLLTIPIEDEIANIDDIRTISSESNEGAAFVWIQFEDISDETFTDRTREIESKVNRLDLPDGSEDPVFNEFSSDDFLPVISASIVGDISERELHDLADAFRDDLLDIDGVGQVALTGTRDREIWIEVDPRKLYQHRLSLGQVVQAISGQNMNVPAGEVALGGEKLLVRSIGEIESPEGFRKIIVRWDPGGNHLHLGEIASVEDTWEEESSRARMNGQRSATISISKSANANSLELIDRVKEIAEQYRSRLPLEAKIVFTNDNSIYINDILGKLQSNARLGFILVLVILYLFMGFRNAFVAAIGIPVAFMATFFFMYQTDQTFNGHSLFGLILVLGIVVDDAIIVVENCFRHLQRGLSRKHAAIVGTKEVWAPVVSATLTTIAAFLPLILMSGIMGKFMRLVPIVVSLTLAASLIEVFVIAPSHFAEWGSKIGTGSDRWFSGLKRIYANVLVWVLRRRYMVLPLVFLWAVLMAGLIPLVGMDLFKGDKFTQFSVFVRMPIGTRLEETDRVIRRIERIALKLPDEEVHAIIANAGILQAHDDWTYAENVGQVIIDLVEPGFRDRDMDVIMDEIRRKVRGIEGPLSITVEGQEGGPPVGKPVAVKIKGKYLDELQEVADALKAELANIPGAYNIEDDYFPGKREVRLIIDEARASLHGLTVAMIASEVRTAINGSVATVYRDADDEIDVRVKLAGMDDGGIEAIRGLTIVSPTGALVRLDNICRFETSSTIFRIKRFERERAITVSAEVDDRKNSTVDVNRELKRRFDQNIAPLHPGYRLDFRGEMQEFIESFQELGKLFFFGVILIFTILGAQFKSLRQSLIILLTIPFGFIGSMIGLLVTGEPFSMMTMYGMVALAGIAVNDAIVMVTFINNARARGESQWRSIIESGKTRLRPIILTSVTTILGLLPMAIGLGGKSASWAPLANTIVWGLAVATLLTLLVIPTAYSIVVDDWFGWMAIKRWRRKRKLARAIP